YRHVADPDRRCQVVRRIRQLAEKKFSGKTNIVDVFVCIFFKYWVQEAGCSARGASPPSGAGVSPAVGGGVGGCAGPDSGHGGVCSVGFFRLRISKVATATTAPTAAIIPIIISHGRPAVA